MGTSRRVVPVVVAMLLAAFTPTARAADPEAVWSERSVAALNDVATDAAGRIYVVGTTRTRRGQALFLAKHGPAGRRLWRRTWRAPGELGWAEGRTVTVAPDGGVYVGGASGSFEHSEPLLRRYSASGRLVWSRILPTSIGGYQRASVVGVAVGGGVVVAAVLQAGTFDDVFHDGGLQAFDRAGRPRWQVDFEAPGITGTWDAIAGVAVGARGRIYTAGHVDRAPYGSPADPWPDQDIVVQQLTPTGHVRWTRVLGDGEDRDLDRATGVSTRDRQVVVVGVVDERLSRPRQGFWVGAFGANGDRRWMRTGGSARSPMRAVAVVHARWGAIYVGGVLGSDPSTSWLRQYGRNGQMVWERIVGRGERREVTSVATSGGVYVTVGYRLERWRR